MTNEEAKKAGFRHFDKNQYVYWQVAGEFIHQFHCCASSLRENDFPTRAKAREALRKRKLEAEHAKWLDDMQSQTTPITPEQVKMLSRDDVVFMYDIASLGISGIRGYTAINDNSYVTSPLFFTEQAARDRLNEVMAVQAALAKAVPSETEHKFPEVPSWCPPLLEGDVPLGFGGTFKGISTINTEIHGMIKGVFSSLQWDTSGYRGNGKGMFYAAPRNSEIAKLNYPWLAEETKAEQVNPTDKWIERKEGEIVETGDEVFDNSDFSDGHPSGIKRWHWDNCWVGHVVHWTRGPFCVHARYRNPLWLAKYGKDVASHETPVGETQGKEVVTDETQDPEPVKCIMDGDEFCGITPEWQAWQARQDAKVSNKEHVAPVEVAKRGTTESERSSNKSDAVSHPSHYTSHPSGVECITITKHMNFCRGNAVKYLWRAGQKGDSLEKEIEDIAKAEEYCRIEKERLIALKGAK